MEMRLHFYSTNFWELAGWLRTFCTAQRVRVGLSSLLPFVRLSTFDLPVPRLYSIGAYKEEEGEALVRSLVCNFARPRE